MRSRSFVLTNSPWPRLLPRSNLPATMKPKWSPESRVSAAAWASRAFPAWALMTASRKSSISSTRPRLRRQLTGELLRVVSDEPGVVLRVERQRLVPLERLLEVARRERLPEALPVRRGPRRHRHDGAKRQESERNDGVTGKHREGSGRRGDDPAGAVGPARPGPHQENDPAARFLDPRRPRSLDASSPGIIRPAPASTMPEWPTPFERVGPAMPAGSTPGRQSPMAVSLTNHGVVSIWYVRRYDFSDPRL